MPEEEKKIGEIEAAVTGINQRFVIFLFYLISVFHSFFFFFKSAI